MPLTTICAKPGCELEIPVGRLACPPHWYALPSNLRARIWRTWRERYTTSPTDGGGLPAHQAAILEALRHWTA